MWPNLEWAEETNSNIVFLELLERRKKKRKKISDSHFQILKLVVAVFRVFLVCSVILKRRSTQLCNALQYFSVSPE